MKFGHVIALTVALGCGFNYCWSDEPTTNATKADAETKAAVVESSKPDATEKKEEPAPAPQAKMEPADVAWMLVSSALVLMMTAPGLALFYGGLVRKKNILGVMMQCLMLMGAMSLLWAIIGYSLVFAPSLPGTGGFIGGFDYVLLNGTVTDSSGSPILCGTIPRLLHMVYQMMFFIITPALICGAFAERMKFSSMMVYCMLWGLFVYCPVAHWVWADDGWCNFLNANAAVKAYDFAGGTVVHITSGISALVCALLLGKRLGFGQEPMPPHNLSYTFIGATLLWVGWFGFNAGSALAANMLAVNAFVATHLAAAAGTVTWACLEWVKRGKPSILGACSGAVAGLVCVTPACGSCAPGSGILLGIAASVVCFWACTSLKNSMGYDDSLDAFGVHGVGGTLGALLTGVFATKAVVPDATNPSLPIGLVDGNAMQVVNQAIATGAAIAIAVIVSVILLKVLDAVMGLRVSQNGELQGLDIDQHGEEGYIFH